MREFWEREESETRVDVVEAVEEAVEEAVDTVR